MEILFINAVLLTLLAVVTVAIVVQRNLFSVVILSSIYSFLMASVLMVYDAVDVAMTEASVGAGISTVVLLGTLALTGKMEYPHRRSAVLPLVVSVILTGVLVWSSFGMAPFGSPDNIIHKHVGPEYLARSIPEMGVPNVVTSTLANYRSFDTLGETTVILTAGISVLLLLRGRRKRKQAGAKAAQGSGERETAS